MIHTIKKAITVFSLVVFGSVLVYNCEPDPDSLGEQLFLDGAAQGKEEAFDVIAFNIMNNDNIRSDAGVLLDQNDQTIVTSAVLGAFHEENFGTQKASFLTQIRLSTYNPDFGANAEVDSVVLVVKPTYDLNSVITTTDESYIYPDGNVAAKKVVNTYPVKKFGNTEIGGQTTFNIKVFEVETFLKSSSDTVRSNQNFAINPTPIGSKVFNGNINSVAITKDEDGSSLLPATTTSTPGIRISLDKTLFKTKIIDMKGKPELQDASNFIRHFKGLKIAVDENDGYLFNITPSASQLVMYYKYDKTENGTTTRAQANYAFDLGSTSGNSYIGQYEYNRTGSVLADPTTIIGNRTNGDPKLFVQGMGGPSIGIKFKASELEKLKQKYLNDKTAIISAKIRIYTDGSLSNNYAKPTQFTFFQKDPTNLNDIKSTFTRDATLFGKIFTSYNLDKNPAYYEFVVTQTLKDIIENTDAIDSNSVKYFKIDMGTFLKNEGLLVAPNYNSIASNINRAVLVGNNNGENKVQLRVIYGTK